MGNTGSSRTIRSVLIGTIGGVALLLAAGLFIRAREGLASGSFTIENPSPSLVDLQPVTLHIHAAGAKQMRFGNTEYERANAPWEPYAATKSWILKSGPELKTVYAEFRNGGRVALAQEAARPDLVATTFDGSRSGWYSYDYKAEFPQNIFYPVTLEARGGVNDSGYVWTDDSRWGEDTPEDPHSVLAFLTYREWVGGGHLDLRDAKVSLFLRGDELNLKGAKVYFWVMVNSTRFHYTAFPLEVHEGVWTQNSFPIAVNTALWHRSWAGIGKSESLETVLNAGLSYGISFVGFPYGDEPTGRLSMDELTVELAH